MMADGLANGNVALALLANTIATGTALVALILAFGQISGAHFNPVVTLMDALEKGLPWPETPHYIVGQVLGGITGAVTAHLMFAVPVISLSHHARSGPPQVFSEFVATFGLVSVIWGCSRLRSNAVAFAVGAYITAAYWFTASTSVDVCDSAIFIASDAPRNRAFGLRPLAQVLNGASSAGLAKVELSLAPGRLSRKRALRHKD
jgi:glycerol uptake facilitator-like aquaporin